VINNRSGILYLFPENTRYSNNDMEYYKSVFGVRENAEYIEEENKSEYKYNAIKNKDDINDFYKYSKEILNDENIMDEKDIRKYIKKIYFKNTFIGYIGLTNCDGKKTSKKYLGVRSFMILPEYQRMGHGANIINDIVGRNKTKYDEIFCWVEKNNIGAINFYQKIGDVWLDKLFKNRLYYVVLYKKSNTNVSENSNLTKFAWYHAEIKRDGFNPKKAGGWDEELYSKDIESCIHNDIEYNYHFKGKDKTEAYLYTAGEELSSVYLGKITVYRTDKGVDWEWSEQEPIDSKTVDYLKNEVQKQLLENGDIEDVEEYAPSSFIKRSSKPAKNQKAHKNYLKRKSRGKTNNATDQKVMPKFNQIGEEALTSKQRNGLDDNDFGIPELRKYPIHDKKHVEQAVKMFNHVDKEYEKILAKRLLKAMRKFGVSTDSIGEKNRLRSYISETFIYEAGKSKKPIKPIFIVNSFTNTPFGKVISTYTHNKYSHSAISFDTSLETLYSFNADNQSNIFGGISVESISGYIDKYENSSIQVNCLFVKESDYEIIRDAVNTMIENKTSTAYGYNNLINILLNKYKEMGQNAMSMVCSQFVSYVLSKADIHLTDKTSNLVTPKDLSTIVNPKVYKVYEGYARLYNKSAIDRMMRKVSKNATVIKEYSIRLDD